MQVLDANPAHIKALYRRGMAYMTAGDFEEAKRDFNMVTLSFPDFQNWIGITISKFASGFYQMIKLDKSSEPDAKAALQKVKQKEQVG